MLTHSPTSSWPGLTRPPRVDAQSPQEFSHTMKQWNNGRYAPTHAHCFIVSLCEALFEQRGATLGGRVKPGHEELFEFGFRLAGHQ
jgi:hypothetical protein